MKPERILVTGGAGFIGSHSVDYLLKKNCQVIVLDNLSSGKSEHLDMNHPSLEFIEGDVLELPLVVDLLQSCDAVLHLAAIASVSQSIAEPIYSMQVNTQGFVHVLQAAFACHRPIKIVYASSAAVYGDTALLPCREQMHCEQYAGLFAALHGIPSLGLRYFNVYGDGQDASSPYSGVISRFLDLYKQEQALMIYGDGLQSRDFIHVSDVARANWLALQSQQTGALNIATGKPETLLALIEYIEAAGNKPAIRSFADARVGDIRASFASIHLAQERLAFTAEVALKDGIAKLVE